MQLYLHLVSSVLFSLPTLRERKLNSATCLDWIFLISVCRPVTNTWMEQQTPFAWCSPIDPKFGTCTSKHRIWVNGITLQTHGGWLKPRPFPPLPHLPWVLTIHFVSCQNKNQSIFKQVMFTALDVTSGAMCTQTFRLYESCQWAPSCIWRFLSFLHPQKISKEWRRIQYCGRDGFCASLSIVNSYFLSTGHVRG